MEVEFRKHLPPYRSLVDPKSQYDYRTHSFVQFSQLDLSKVLLGYQLPKLPRSNFKMKYKLLLSDVSMRASLLSRKVPSVKQTNTTNTTPKKRAPATTFNDLPEEIQIHVFSLVDDTPSYQNCLYTCKTFYRLAKPFMFRYVAFSSTFRFAQFITYLRLNPALGCHVLEVDLSQLKPGNWELEAQSDTEQEENDTDQFHDILAIWAGWRDWKFANNPLYTLHPLPATPLTKALLHAPHGPPSPKKRKFLRYFKKRRRSHAKIEAPEEQRPLPGARRHSQWLLQHLSHPKINKFLMNYSSLKDVPIGYIIHLINMCPNLRSLNLGSLSLSTDYMISPKMSQKYQAFDIMNNYSKETVDTIDNLYPMADDELFFKSEITRRIPDLTSLASSVFSMSTLSKPIRKYNSLLPPLPKLVRDILYLQKGDGLVFLSDLNLKSINSAHLETINESEILKSLCKRSRLEYINLLSMIWINLRLVKLFISGMLAEDLKRKKYDGKECTVFKDNYFSSLELLDEEDEDEDTGTPKRMLLDLSNSGMNKNLRWAQPIDLETRRGRKLVHKILNDELLPPFEEFMLRERDRMGRPGENYFS
ncbi:hypothetical protein C7M61_003754 [Candidozyma pseudohaemuli]|uniref:F-box domain-containing protein n=1 Tax=Candidozyma pseudohaemuli TaxID=418784 RepID=A0A2P7YLN5_9ASCO|nr:hypothetical protein C7M61_003754 [[Candida] pseudohaemulonii]PSK36890.1 hypothetical protein C7M61_003754 [[Candida] pseudohaemulonii]